MRKAFLEVVRERAAKDPDLWFLTGDLGFRFLEPYREAFPDRFLNCGVAEQAMMGLAAGLALAGKRVVVYSIANFPTFRALEQIRNDLCHHHLPVTVVTAGAGMIYGAQGYTHHAVEDLSILMALPGLTVLAPGDPHEARAATRAALTLPGPAYLRLGRAGDPEVHDREVDFVPGRPLILTRGRDVCLIGSGGGLKIAADAAALLADEGVSVTLGSLPGVMPLDEEAAWELIAPHTLAGVVEEHSLIGGLGDRVASLLARRGQGPRLLTFGLKPENHGLVGGRDYLLARNGLTPRAVADRIKENLAGA